ncbi:Epsin domain [Macleaya cordata]|uniref:Epsin domain n=1 Tax=Macleaya cordata TaxID=56857 RepID=A0A200Q6Z2_MACCD|nr:Epsin domain [Macleaya cordata]
MSIVGKNNNMGTPFFHEFKKQASFFLKEKIKTARLVLTDVTPAELLTEEATNGNPWAPDTRTMGLISRAAFEVDDYWRIVEILHKRLLRFDRKNWRVSYKSLILLEHLLTHGPGSVAEEFQSDIHVIQEMGSFQYIDERGFNWGQNVRKKSERILKLLEKGPLLKEERNRARKVTREIQGFGSFTQRSSTADGSFRGPTIGMFERCNSDYINHENQNNQFSSEEGITEGMKKTQHQETHNSIVPEKPIKDLNSQGGSNEGWIIKKSEIRTSSKENMMPRNELLPVEFHKRTCLKESKPLLGCDKDEPRNEPSIDEEDHPFNSHEHQSTSSLLSARNGILQGC